MDMAKYSDTGLDAETLMTLADAASSLMMESSEMCVCTTREYRNADHLQSCTTHNASKPLLLLLPPEIQELIFRYAFGGQTFHVYHIGKNLQCQLCKTCLSTRYLLPGPLKEIRESRAKETQICSCDSTIWHPNAQSSSSELWAKTGMKALLGVNLLLTCKQIHEQSRKWKIEIIREGRFCFRDEETVLKCFRDPTRFLMLYGGHALVAIRHIRLDIIINNEWEAERWNQRFALLADSLPNMRSIHFNFALNFWVSQQTARLQSRIRGRSDDFLNELSALRRLPLRECKVQVSSEAPIDPSVRRTRQLIFNGEISSSGPVHVIVPLPTPPNLPNVYPGPVVGWLGTEKQAWSEEVVDYLLRRGKWA